MEQKKRWRAKDLEPYYFVGSDGYSIEILDNHQWHDNERFCVGNYFKTDGAAEACAAEVREVFIRHAENQG